jgi:DNA invertase Pin-like site-specific DNA recombinase
METDRMMHSLSTQVSYYSELIQKNPEWQYVGVYADNFISGTSTNKRTEFQRMVADCEAGKIDLIVTKSVSRFARNTVDSLTTIRELKENGTEVYFEKENIWTFYSKGELLLTIMSSLAQEESRSISENCTWGQRKRFADGKVTVPFARFLGYDRGEDGNLVVNPEQAVTVKRIYSLFLQGKTPHGICQILMDDGIPSPSGKKKWNQSTVKSILMNEKYKGDALLQKSYTVNFLTKRTKTNEGEIPQYYVEGNHKAIIDPETFEMVQREMARRTKGRNRHSGVHLFSGKIKCGDCGGWYGSKVWHSNDVYKRTIWQCNQKYKNEKRCTTPFLDEATIKARFLTAANILLAGRPDAIRTCEAAIKTVFDLTDLLAEQERLHNEMTLLSGMMEESIRQNATVAQDQAEYQKRFDDLSQRFDTAKQQHSEVSNRISDMKSRKGEMMDFLKLLKTQEDQVTVFSDGLWTGLLDYATVYADSRMTFTFKNGQTIDG